MRREKLSVLPGSLQIKLDVERGLALALRASSETAVRRGVEELNRKIRDANRTLFEGPATSVAALDPEQVVSVWRKGRG